MLAPPFRTRPLILEASHQVAIKGNGQNGAFTGPQLTAGPQLGKKRNLRNIGDAFETECASSNGHLNCRTLLRLNHFGEDLIEQQNRRSEPAQESDVPDLHEVQEN